MLGSDFTDVSSPTELGVQRAHRREPRHTRAARARRAHRPGPGERLGQADPRPADELRQLAEIARAELKAEHAALLAVIVNRADRTDHTRCEIIGKPFAARYPPSTMVWAIPEDPYLVAPSMRSILDAIDGTLGPGDEELLAREALGVVVAGMSMVNVLPRLIEGAVIVIPGDRVETLLAVLMANASGTFPSVAGIVLNGGFDLPEPITRLIDGLRSTLPVISTDLGTYETTVRITNARGRLAADSQRKYDTALALFERNVDGVDLLQRLDVSRSTWSRR